MARGAGRGRRARRARARTGPAGPRHARGTRARRAAVCRPVDALRQHDRRRGRTGDARRPGGRAPAALAGALERDRDDPAGQQGVLGARRAHRLVPVGGGALRGRLQPLLARADRRARRRPRLHPGALLARDLRPRVPRGPADARADRELPPGGRRAGTVVLSAPVADAGLLAVPDGVDGARAADGDLPGALHEVPERTRDRRRDRAQGVGVHGRRRDGRARVDGRDLDGRARAPRQPRLRHQLQPAAPRRAGARQRRRSSRSWRRTSAARAGTSSR